MAHLPRLPRADLALVLIAGTTGALVAAQAGSLDPVRGTALALAAAATMATAWCWPRVQAQVGPRHVLDLALPLAVVVLVVLSAWEPLGLPRALAVLTHPILATCITLAWLGLAGLAPAGEDERGPLAGAALLAGGLLWLALAHVLGMAAPLGYLALVAGMVAAWSIAWPIRDPFHPGPSPLAPYTPWGEHLGRPWPPWYRVPLAAPAVLGYLVLSWVIFLWLGEPGVSGLFGLDTNRYEAFLYEIPDLSRAPLEGLASMVTAPLLNHDHIQLIYVTALLLLFGLPFEVQEGTLRTAVLFAGTSLAGALVAGIALHAFIVAYPEVAFFQEAWERTWSGGSAGAFGLMGALSARAARPWPLLGFFLFWELNVGAWYLASYTPAFHLTALVSGYLVTRHGLPPRAEQTL